MKAAEILRKLADLIDGQSQEAPAVSLAPVEVDNTDNTETTTMVPPLQAKLELLKKATGVENYYDDEATPCDSAEDAELALMKQRAGITPAVIVASDDEPLDM
jgi:hypothetical protein